MTEKRKPILCLDFDGVLHSYTSGWQGADVIPDPPVEGAMKFIENAVHHFDVQIFSSRTNESGGEYAMKLWIRQQLLEHFGDHNPLVDKTFSAIKWPNRKPPAFVTIDDRAITFTGEWPSVDELLAFQPWNKKD